MLTVKQGLDAIRKENVFVERQIKEHQNRLKKAINDLENQILFLFSEKLIRENGRLISTKVKLKQAQKLHKQLTILFEQEFGVAVKSVIANFDTIADAIEQRFKAFDEAYKFVGISKTTISALKTAAMKEFNAFGSMARERVAAALYHAVIIGGQFNALQREIRSILTGRYNKVGRPMTSYAGQMAFDQTMTFHNQLNVAEAARADISSFLYYGNTQANTRSFCRNRVGNVYSRSQIESWTHRWDGKSGPAMTHRGGYNCRHSWVPVRKEWFKGKEAEVRVQQKEVQKK